MQHAFDLDRGDGGALQRGQQHAAQRIAQRQAKAAFQRFGGDGGGTARVMTGFGLELAGFDQFLPVFLKHVFLIVSRACRTMPIRSTGYSKSECNYSYAAALGRAAAIVRDRRHVADGGDDQAHGLQRAQRGFAARTGARDFHFQGAHAVFDRLLGGVFGGHLRRIGRGFARTLEAHHAGRGPADGVALGVGDGDDGVVEGGGDMRHADHDVLLFFLAGARSLAARLLVISHGITWSLSSCRRSPWQAPCGCGRWCGYAGRGPAGSCGDAGPGSSPDPSGA